MLKNGKIIIFLTNFKYVKFPEKAFSGLLGVLKFKTSPSVATMVPSQVDTGFIINLPFWTPSGLERMKKPERNAIMTFIKDLKIVAFFHHQALMTFLKKQMFSLLTSLPRKIKYNNPKQVEMEAVVSTKARVIFMNLCCF